MKSVIYPFLVVGFVLLLASCSTTKYVPDGSYLLDGISIESDNKDINTSDLSLYLRQSPNSKLFSLFHTQLYLYNLSGRDSTKWVNKVLRRIGDAPVIFSEEEDERTRDQLTRAVRNMGYMGASVESITETKKKKKKVTYRVTSGKPYIVRSLNYDIPDATIWQYIQADSANSLLHEGMNLNINLLNEERQRIATHLLNNGYYRFNKELLTYTADTVRNTYQADVTLHLQPNTINGTECPYHQYYINKVSFVTDYDVLQRNAQNAFDVTDSLNYRGYPVYYKNKLYIRPRTLTNTSWINPGELYNQANIQKTYNNFGRLSALRYTNVRFEQQANDSTLLNAFVLLTKNKLQSISFELEGTNSAGDLGAAASVSYQNRNLFRGSELFMFRIRGAYEAVSGLHGQYRNESYTELGAETSINFPQFLFPFLSHDFRKNIHANTEFGMQYNYQMRPEFTRIVASTNWSYKWQSKSLHTRHQIDAIDINYLYMPWLDPKFKERYLDEEKNYILRYNYEDRLIVRSGYSYSYNSAGGAFMGGAVTENSYSLRFNVESAGNVLYGLAKLTGMHQNTEGEYAILNIPFAQYLKADFDYAKNISFDAKNSLSYHVNLGIAFPYGNAKMVPFEKRYFSGGANSVRGWSVRDLGPGSFPGDGNFLNQTGDIKFDASVELRSKLFWKIQSAVFVDAGNIWTIRNYPSQPGGQFELGKFYKQVAFAYGLGIRLDLDFFILRLDGGMKAINPVYSSGKHRYPIIHPNFGRDFAFHFAVGYPF